MKKLPLRLVGLFLIFSGGLAIAQTPDSKTALELGVCAFKSKNYRLAESEFEKGLQQDPGNKLLMLFTARAIDYQYESKEMSAGSLAKARSAIEAYSMLLAADPADSEASNAIVRLYEQIDAAKLAEIAADEGTPKQIRTAIYVKLAAVGNTCANDITEANKTEVSQARYSGYRYHMPKDPKDLTKAQTCAADGMKFIDKALVLETNNESVWSYKTSLSMQMSHLAEMQQRAAEKASLDRQALAAKAEFTKLAEAAQALQQKADQDEEERWAKERPTAAGNVASMAEFIASGRLVRKVPIDSSSIDPREFSLLSPDDTTAVKQADPPSPPIVWKSVTSPDGAFSVLLPSSFEIVRPLYLAKGEGVSFLLTYVDIPPNAPANMNVDDVMAGTASAMAESVCTFSLIANASCDVRLAKKTSLGTYPGLEYTIAEDNCIKVLPGLLRVYATHNRVYALAAVGGDETNPRVAKFLNSFAIMK